MNNDTSNQEYKFGKAIVIDLLNLFSMMRTGKVEQAHFLAGQLNEFIIPDIARQEKEYNENTNV